MKYEITGRFKIGRDMQRFTKVVEAESEKLARLKILSKIGSDHGSRRADIEIEGVTNAEKEQPKATGNEKGKQEAGKQEA